MTRDETVALFEACEAARAVARADALAEGKDQHQAHAIGHEAAKAHWNSWAEALLTEYRTMEDPFVAANLMVCVSLWNSVRAEWLERAKVDFCFCRFLSRGVLYVERKPEDEAAMETMAAEAGYDLKSISIETVATEFDGFVFPGFALFTGSTFIGSARFRNAVFNGAADFGRATFFGPAWFASSRFIEGAHFRNATFTDQAQFDEVKFSRDTRFERAAFGGDASFMSAIFTSDVSFLGATFTGDAYFLSATFTGAADFWGAIFTSSANFDRARFRWVANFRRITAQGPFSLIGVRFRKRVPDFLSAKFAEPVLLDNIQLAGSIQPGGLLGSIFARVFVWIFGTLDPELSAKYRALKRLAIQSDDHRNEQIFFRGELRARRYNEDKPGHPAFLFGIFYELAADFGHSISRPVLWLLVLSLVSSWFYLRQHAAADISPCAHLQARILSYLPGRVQALYPALQTETLPTLPCKHGDGDAAEAALLVAFRQSSVFGTFDSTKSTQIYACLYGWDGELRTPLVPGGVMLWGTLQAVLSAALWFLFLLALRNQFKIK